MENKYKKGDWVRVVAEGLHGVRPGEIVRIADRASPTNRAWVTLVGMRNDNGDGSYAEDNFEPWQPKVGERVRYVGDKGQFYTNGKDYDVLAVGEEEFSFTDDSNNGPHFWTACTIAGKFIPAPAADTPPVAEPLTITAGKFYKTRDGRNVGPMERNVLVGCQKGANGEKYTWSDSDGGNTYTDGGRYAYDTTHDHEDDLVAEWVDTPAAPVTNLAATVDAINDEYGPVVREVYGDRDNDTTQLTVTIDAEQVHDELDTIIAKLKKIRKLQRELGLIAA